MVVASLPKPQTTIAHSTVTDNDALSASSNGDGIWNDNDIITITHSIIAENGSVDLSPGHGPSKR